MFSFLSVIPIVGPIIQGVVDIFNKKSDVDLQKTLSANLTALEKQKDLSKADVAIIQARTQIALAHKDDLGARLVRDLIMFPVGVHTCLYYWNLSFPMYGWGVTEPTQAMQYIPYAVIAWLFVTSYRGSNP
jgi:hypothetical protein